MTESLRIGQPPQAPAPKPGRWSRRTALIVGGVVVLVLAVAGAMAVGILKAGHDTRAEAAASKSAAPGVGTIRGVVVLRLAQFAWDSGTSTCWGKGRYDDLDKGTQVTVTDAGGKTVGVGSIVDSSPQTSVSGDGARAESCTLSFEVPNVPRGGGFYGVEVAHRGVINKSESDVFTTALQLSIG